LICTRALQLIISMLVSLFALVLIHIDIAIMRHIIYVDNVLEINSIH